MRKICLVDYDMSVRGGVEQVTASLANALVESFEVHVISLCLQHELAYELSPQVKFIALLQQETRLREMMGKVRVLLKEYFKKHEIDVVIIQGNYPGLLVSQMRIYGKTKLVFCDHGALMNQWKQKDIVFIRWISSVLCHKVITLTHQSKNDYIRKFCLREKKVDCIYNWIDLETERSVQYDTDSRRIISAGRFGYEKGFDRLVKVFAMVAEKHPDWHLDLFGDGDMMPAVKQLIAEHGLENNIHLMGMRSDLSQRYQNYAMYVLPSYREGMPLVLLEAKANRLPIISFDIMTGPREIIRDGVDGILVPPNDLQKMSDMICALIEDKTLRGQMAERSQENLNQFSKQTILNQWKALLNELSV